MKTVTRSLFFATVILSASVRAGRADEPIRLHPDNPHYFLWRGRPTLLIAAGEHYGAVLNLDFDYGRYLEALQSNRFNLTRVFSGTYREVPGSFNITGNTLAPGPGRYVCPWARSEATGAAEGGNKFDLTRWDAAYFDRLKDFARQAGQRDVVVELVFFCTMYSEDIALRLRRQEQAGLRSAKPSSEPADCFAPILLLRPSCRVRFAGFAQKEAGATSAPASWRTVPTPPGGGPAMRRPQARRGPMIGSGTGSEEPINKE